MTNMRQKFLPCREAALFVLLLFLETLVWCSICLSFLPVWTHCRISELYSFDKTRRKQYMESARIDENLCEKMRPNIGWLFDSTVTNLPLMIEAQMNSVSSSSSTYCALSTNIHCTTQAIFAVGFLVILPEDDELVVEAAVQEEKLDYCIFVIFLCSFW